MSQIAAFRDSGGISRDALSCSVWLGRVTSFLGRGSRGECGAWACMPLVLPAGRHRHARPRTPVFIESDDGCKERERLREGGRGSGGGVAAPDISLNTATGLWCLPRPPPGVPTQAWRAAAPQQGGPALCYSTVASLGSRWSRSKCAE